jgi:hypothetical protein
MVTYDHLDAIFPIRRRLPFYIATGMSMAAMYLLAWIDNSLRLWPAFGLDYSGHTGFATVLLASIVLWHRRLLIPSILALCAYAGLMLYQKYHSVADIVTTLIVIMPITVAAHIAADRVVGRAQITTVRQQ